MKRPGWVRKSGPYKCASFIDSRIEVQASWGQYGAVWNAEDGGGPGFPGRMELAYDLETWLNSIYSPDEIAEAEQRIAEREANRKAAYNETTPGIVQENASLRAALENLLTLVLQDMPTYYSAPRGYCAGCGQRAPDVAMIHHHAICPVAIAEKALRGE